MSTELFFAQLILAGVVGLLVGFGIGKLFKFILALALLALFMTVVFAVLSASFEPFHGLLEITQRCITYIKPFYQFVATATTGHVFAFAVASIFGFIGFIQGVK